jgi:general secretion pathway protein K
MAMLIVSLAAIAATYMLAQQSTALLQLEASRDLDQARWILRGGTQWARTVLAQDAKVSVHDHAGELWATPLPPTRIEQGIVEGEIRDQQGLFNLNNLVRDGKASARDVDALKRLLQVLGLRTELADAIADWIDADSERLAPGGAEDPDYLRLPAPRRAANRALVEMGDLHQVRGGDEKTLARLRPFVTVLPQRGPINANTAPAEVLVAVVEGLSMPEALALTSERRTAPFRDIADLRARLPRRELLVSDDVVSVTSRFFLVRGRATIGKADLRGEALLQREGTSLPSIVWQRTS